MTKKNNRLLLLIILLNGVVHAKLDIDFDTSDHTGKTTQFLKSELEQKEVSIVQQQPIEKIEHIAQQAQKEAKAFAVGGELPHTESGAYLQELQPALRAEMQDEERREEKKKRKKRKEKKEEPLIEFNFKDAKLTDLINEIAAKKGINIVLPQGAKALKTTITFDLEHKVPLSIAERYMFTMLELAGYTMYPTDGFFIIDKKPENADTLENRGSYHLYVNLPPNELPQSSENIHAIYYLSNLQVPKASGEDTLSKILRDMIGMKKYLFDEKSNAIIITGPADKIASTMTIILELDAAGASEVVEVLPLFNANAVDVAKILKEQLIKTAAKPAAQQAGKVSLPEGTGTYFVPGTRIVPDVRTNSLILIGTESAITRIRDFVREYMDQLPESGKSILHVYDLQYLKAKDFMNTLNTVVTQSKTGQSTQAGGGAGGEGAQRMFDSVIVQAETFEAAPVASGGKETKTPELGGNRLIIAAQHDDYQRIKELVQQLDKPQMQVIIEVVILDISVTGSRLLQTQLRNLSNIPLHDSLQMQTANITYPGSVSASNVTTQVASGSSTTSSAISGSTLGQITSQMASPVNNPPVPQVPVLATDLLELLTGTNNNSQSAASLVAPGTMLVSFKDPCTNAIAALLAILDQWVEKKVISHPFLVTKNNIKARQSLINIRQGAGRDISSGGTTTVRIEDFTAKIAIEMTPRVSTLDRLALQIHVAIEDFINSDPTSFDRTTRVLDTNASMNTGQILILGGLMQEIDSESETKIPILGDIPIFGWLFRGVARVKTKNNLVVLIHPTVVHPKLRSGERVYTNDVVRLVHDELTSDTLFNNAKDPITRWFFNVGNTSDEVVAGYLETTHYNKQIEGEAYHTVEYTGPPKAIEVGTPKVKEKLVDQAVQKEAKSDAKKALFEREEENITQHTIK